MHLIKYRRSKLPFGWLTHVISTLTVLVCGAEPTALTQAQEKSSPAVAKSSISRSEKSNDGRDLTSADVQLWIEDSFDDFADGRFDAAGENIYASADGTIRTIHRFDLNQDGWIDVIYNSTHDTYYHVPAKSVSIDDNGAPSQATLEIRGSVWCDSADLNRDGHQEAIFLPSQSSGTPRLTICYGSETGWSLQRTSTLPVGKATRLVVADLNNDTWPDLVVLHPAAWAPGQPQGGIVRIYWNLSGTFLPSRSSDIAVEHCIDLAAFHINETLGEAVAVLCSTGTVDLFWPTDRGESTTELERSQIKLPLNDVTCVVASAMHRDNHDSLIIGSNHDQACIVNAQLLNKPAAAHLILKTDQRLQPPETIVAQLVEVPSATNITVGDLDADGWSDLAIVNFSLQRAAGNEAVGSKIDSSNQLSFVWGKSGGFSTGATNWRIPNASSTAIGDLNRDGILDVAVSVYQGSKTFAAQSKILLGRGGRTFKSIDGPKTQGALRAVICPQETGQRARVLFAGSQGGRLFERVSTQIYWNGPLGFQSGNRSTIDFESGYAAAAADLNRDNYVDLVILNSGHSGGLTAATSNLGANILWGGPQGFDIKNNSTVLHHRSLCSVNIADLNRDGILDLVLGQFDSPPDVENLYVYYGDTLGFSEAKMAALPSPGRSHSCVIADFNRDDWLDIAVASTDKHLVRVFWGSSVGFVEGRQDIIPVYLPIDIATADLNGDNYLDLVAGSFKDYVRNDPSNLGETTILWGARSGFSRTNAQWLPGYSPLGYSIADFDNDGVLDLLSPHYDAGFARESLPTYLFWGSVDGFNLQRKSILVANSAADSLAADFNKDGKLDIALVCHRVDDDHRTESQIIYNDGKRFDNPKVTTLPTQGPHWMWGHNMGRIYDRKWEQFYESSAFHMSEGRSEGTLTAEVESPEGTRLQFAIRSAITQHALSVAKWRVLKDAGGFSFDGQDRWLQYRAVFKSDNGDQFSILDRVVIELTETQPH